MTDPTHPGLTDDEHELIRQDLAGYVLGGLDVDEQRALEQHLTDCASCREELAELDPVPVLLELSRSPDEVRPAAPTPAPARQRRAVLVGAAAAVLVALALVAGVVIGRGDHPSSPGFGPPLTLQAVGADTSSGTAALRPTGAGTQVRLDLTGLRGGDGTWYECIWVSTQGPQSAGTFRAGADGTVQVDLTTAATRYPGWQLEIRSHPPDGTGGQDGTTVLRAGA